MAAILGISAYYHDSAASLVVDGRIVAAAQEERFTRIKHDAAFPTQAVACCLKEAGLSLDRVDYVAFYDKPLTKFERLLETYLAFAPRGFRSFCKAIPLWLKEKLFMRRTLHKHLLRCSGRILFLDHHESHAASAFFPSPYDEAAILTLDGVGEWSTASFGVGRGNRLELQQHMQFPHSLGLLYSAFTYHCGFKVNSGEYKLMGLAPYGRPVYKDLILKHLALLKDDGSFWLDMRYFNYCQGLTMTSPAFDRLFGGTARDPETDIEQRHMDMAASIQAVTEEIVLRMARTLRARTGLRHLVLAGGVALNCVANGKLLATGLFDDVWIQPAAGDAGGALGAALFVWHQLLDQPRKPESKDAQQGSFLGPRVTHQEIGQYLTRAEVPYEHFSNREDLLDQVAELLAQGKIVGWFHGRMEFGPRALGARSILGDPRSPKMQSVMNLKIKFRESFRPFAPMVLQEQAHAWFDMKQGQESPYMLLVFPVRAHHHVAIDQDELARMQTDPDLRKRVNVVRSTIPAVTHVDYSARVQTVDRERHPLIHRLIEKFARRTGCPIVVNTSFNVRGEPIVCSCHDAFRCFQATEMDVLVLEDFLLEKDKCDFSAQGSLRAQYLAQFALD
jgi:carbamoyltransferase